MKSKTKRLSPTKDVLRALFARSGNRCAFPGCTSVLIDDENNFVGQVCHIEAAGEGGERFNANQTDEERRDYKNLLLLCYPHHIKTNNVTTYPVEVLHKIKSEHESSTEGYSTPTSVIDQVYNTQLRFFNERFDRIDAGLQRMQSKSDLRFDQLEAMISQMGSGSLDKGTLAEIETIKQLRNENKHLTALLIIESVRKNQWATLSKENKYQLLANEGLVKIELRRMIEAGNLFIEALSFNPESENALALASWGHMLLNQHDEANKLIDQTLAKNPKNANAYNCFINLNERKGFRWLRPQIPTDLMDVPEICFNLGLIAQREKLYDEAIQMFQSALDYSKNDNSFYSGCLGATIVESVTQDLFRYATQQIDQESRSKLKYAIDLIDGAWKNYERTDLEKQYCWLLIDRSVAKKITHDLDGAYEDIIAATKISPDDPYIVRHLAVMYLNQENYEKVLSLSERLIEVSPEEEKLASIIVKVEALQSLKRYEDSLVILLPLNSKSLPFSERKGVIHYIIKAYSRIDQLETAIRFLDGLVEQNPNEIFVHIEAAIFWFLKKNSDKCNQHLNFANALLSTSTNEDLYELANLLYVIGNYAESANVFERIVDATTYSNMTRSLIRSLIKAGEKKKALTICLDLEKNWGTDQFLSEVLSMIYESVGDIENALAINERYLRINPDDQIVLVRQAFFYERLSETSKLRETLAKITAIDYTLPFHHLNGLARLFYVEGSHDKAMEIAYETRRRYFDVSKAHFQYFSFITSLNPAKLEPKEVSINTAVQLVDSTGALFTYIIEANAPRIERNELAPDDKLAVLLVGKSLGANIAIDKRFGERQVYEIVQIQSKYEYAFNETIRLFQTRFIDEPDIVTLKIGEGNTPQERLKPIFDLLDKDESGLQQMYKFYKDGKASIGLIASMRKANPIRTFYILAGDPTLGIFPVWALDELANARERLDEESVLVFDLTTILTFAAFKRLPLLEILPHKKVIAQSTFEEITALIRELSSFPQGQTMIGKVDGEYVKHETTAEQMKSNIEYYQNLHDWVKLNCSINPHRAILDLPTKQVEERQRLLGTSFHDSLIIAQELNAILLSEDNVFRQLAFAEYKVKGIPTFLFLYYLRIQNKISDIDHAQFMVDLFGFNYKGMPCDPSMLSEALKRSNFNLSSTLENTIKGIASPFLNDRLSSAIAVAFFFELYTTSHFPIELSSDDILSRREQIVGAALNVLFSRPVNLPFLSEAIAVRFLLHQDEGRELTILINGYLQKHTHPS